MCGLTSAGAAHCWGSNILGELGDGTFIDHVTPGPITGFVFKDITSSGAFACGRIAPRFGYCWGANARGQLGDGSITARGAPVRVVQ